MFFCLFVHLFLNGNLSAEYSGALINVSAPFCMRARELNIVGTQ